MMPKMCDGSSWLNGNMKPVTLVSTVVARKISVRPPRWRPPSMPNSTMIPLAIPIRLMTTCSVVKLDMDIPRIMGLVSPVVWLASIDDGRLPNTPAAHPIAGYAPGAD